MDTDRAYLLGLMIGGATFGSSNDRFTIKLPFKKWGSYAENPQRVGEIGKDILNKVGQMFQAVYGISVYYDTNDTKKFTTWTIICSGDIKAVKDDLAKYGIACNGELRGNVDLAPIVSELIDDNLKRRFIAGLADTIGSMAKSHRRFDDEHQIISFEIKGYNFQFVCDLCRLLYSVDCIPDQVNWNHPNIHCTNDPYYDDWNKGFKLRILLDQYAQFGAFAFRTKAESSIKNRKLQRNTHEAEQCETRSMHFNPSTVHPAENDYRLPDVIRGGHYINFRHFCAVLGCEHAPYCAIKAQFDNIGSLINPFPILHKDELPAINSLIKSDPLMASRNYNEVDVTIAHLLRLQKNAPDSLLYGNTVNSGYPISKVLMAVAYIVADESEMTGKRTKDYMVLLKKHVEADPLLSVHIEIPDILTPLVLSGNGRGALVGALNPDVYKKLVSIAPDNDYKLIVRQITEEDLM